VIHLVLFTPGFGPYCYFFEQSITSSFYVQHEGFAFVYMEDERDAEDAIGRLDGVDFGRKGRRIRVEWTKVSRCEKRILTC
jgi:RNA recognition motif-containing protein